MDNLSNLYRPYPIGRRDAKCVEEHYLVALCELAVAEALDLPFDPETGLGDLYHVRATNRSDAALVVTGQDNPDSIYILVILEGEGNEECPTVARIVGWAHGRDI